MDLSSNVETSVTVASKVPFGQLCQLFERIHRAKNSAARSEELRKFISIWRQKHDALHSKVISSRAVPNDSFFPALRLIIPSLDRERPSYGVKEVLLAKLFINVLGLSNTSPDAKKILEYRNPKTNTVATGDFAEIAYLHILSKRCTNQGSLTIQEINEHLDKIALYNNQQEKEQVKKTLLSIIRGTSAMEQKWLIRILLKDIKLKLGHSAVLNEFHPDAEELFNVTTNLKQVCFKLRDATVRLFDTEIGLFQPFRPMLALNAKLKEVEKLMDHKTFRLEIKYDGERSQLHKNKSQYKYYSRSGREYSTVFGDNPYSGTLTPFVHDTFCDEVDSCILDGEMMGYDPELKLFMQKGGKFDIKHVMEDSDLQPCFVAFDILFLNGENLASKPLTERLQKLQNVFQAVEGRIQLAGAKQASTNEEVLKYLNDAIDSRDEGIIVKHPGAPYAPNKRKGSGWFKIKPEYVSGVVDDLDLCIVGGKFGSGRHGSLINKFMLGVRDSDQKNSKFKSLCMVGSGYTDTELLQITETLKPHLQVFDKKKQPEWLLVGKEKPEVVVHPRKSVVVQIRATEIVESSAYATGFTLRFPRIVSSRDDKTCDDAMDLAQLIQLKNMAEGKLAARHATLTRESSAKTSRVKSEQLATVAAKFQGVDRSLVEETSTSFQGREFCVISGTSENDKRFLETNVLSNGGSIVQNPTLNTFCIVVRHEKNVRVRNLIKGGKYNIVKVPWLIECLTKKKIMPFHPSSMLSASTETQQKFRTRFDEFGDEYSVDSTESQLKEIFKCITDHKIQEVFPPKDADDRNVILQTYVIEISTKYSTAGFHDLTTSLFMGFSFYVDDKMNLNDSTTQNQTTESLEVAACIMFYGGKLQHVITEDTSHVVVLKNGDGESRLDVINSLRRTYEYKFHVVSSSWVLTSVEKCVLEDERLYIPI